jgi:hypothetical protein
MGRPPIGTRAMTPAERLRRHRAVHGRGADPTNAERQRRWYARQKAKRATEEVARVPGRATEAAAPDPLLAQAVALLEHQGEADLIRRLHANWPHMAMPLRQQMAAGKGFRFWLREG